MKGYKSKRSDVCGFLEARSLQKNVKAEKRMEREERDTKRRKERKGEKREDRRKERREGVVVKEKEIEKLGTIKRIFLKGCDLGKKEEKEAQRENMVPF